MDETKLFQLLGAIAEALQQNREFLEFIQKRDALSGERQAVELERARLELDMIRDKHEEMVLNHKAIEKLGSSRKTLILEGHWLQLVRHKSEMLNAKADSDRAQERAERAAKSLESAKAEEKSKPDAG